jgi:tetratricopeptide (TPR) repeat protein
LEDRGLIGWDRDANRYDAHPIVRGVVWQLTDSKDQRAVYTALEAYFQPITTPHWERVESLADLTPAIELYHILVGLGRFDDALELFNDRLNEATLFRLAAHRDRIAWLELLFPNGPTSLPTLKSPSYQASTLNALSQSYLFSGQPGRATQLRRQAIEIRKRLNEKRNLHVILVNTGFSLLEIGALREAASVVRQGLVLSREYQSQHAQAITLQFLGSLYNIIGEDLLGHITLNRSRRLFRQVRSLQGEGTVSTFLVEMWLRLGEFDKAVTLIKEILQLALDQRVERDFIRAELLQGRAALGLGDLLQADEHLHRSLTRARAVNLVELELPALIAIAELEHRRGHPAEAKVRLDDVWEAAERGPYPLRQADAYNILSAIEVAKGNAPAAIDAATRAYKAAWCDGPPYAYHWGLQKAKAHLAALGAPEPDMPPFDERKFEPLPEVEINPKDEYWVDPDKLD